MVIFSSPHEPGLQGKPQARCVSSGCNSHQQLGYSQLAGDLSGPRVHCNPMCTEAILGSNSGLPVPLAMTRVLGVAATPAIIITPIADVHGVLTPASQGSPCCFLG